jgi:hypothetical protein
VRSVHKARRRALVATVTVLSACAAVTAAAIAYPTSGFTIWTVAGRGSVCANPTLAPACGDGGPATDATIADPRGLAVNRQGDLFIADTSDNRIRKVTPAGTITTIAGNGQGCGDPTGASVCGDGGPATKAKLDVPDGVAVDGKGDVFIADSGDDRIREVSPAGMITTIAGTGANCGDPTGTSVCGDGGAGPAAKFDFPEDIAVSGSDVLVADTVDNRIRELTPNGSSWSVHTLAGTGAGCPAPTDSCGDGGPPAGAQFLEPYGLATDTKGDTYISDSGDDRIRELTPSHIVRTVAGTGDNCTTSTCGDGGSATAATLTDPEGVAVAAGGEVLVSDTTDARVRAFTPGGPIATIAGDGSACPEPVEGCGDGGAATLANVYPSGIAVDSEGDVFVADPGDELVRLLEGPQTGPSGPLGGRGAPGPKGPPGKLVLVAFQTSLDHGRVIVRYALTAIAKLTLTVKPSRGPAATVTRATGHVGVGRLTWNEKLHGRRAKHGSYRLTITATRNGKHTSSTITARI